MIKLKTYIISLLLLLPAFAHARYTGDVNGDNKVDIADVSILISMLTSNVLPTDGTGDMNSDGMYNKKDVDLLVQEILSNKFSILQEFVDLGLSVKWATCNVGATSPEKYGNYYAWGEISAKTSFSESNYKYYSNGTYKALLADISHTFYDAARKNLGDAWRMPKKAEVEELLQKCTWTSSSKNGIKGYTVKGPSGKSIFIPCAGLYNSSGLQDCGSKIYYWTSTRSTDLTSSAYVLSDTGYTTLWTTNRAFGLPIRPVRQ